MPDLDSGESRSLARYTILTSTGLASLAFIGYKIKIPFRVSKFTKPASELVVTV
jgi:hypothetical protein